MELINQHAKKIMEECKVRARDAGLVFDNETLEYIVTNRDLIELSPKVMIPTLYDYWVHDVEVLREQGKYKLYPNNPYETVINSRPAISFYNDNNPDWMNIMIFYHVLGHIDFFQNNILFENTWHDDFVGQALADKRLIDSMRSEYGRWVDYTIEFSRCIDNITGFFQSLPKDTFAHENMPSAKLTYYIEKFLQEVVEAPSHDIFREIERYNELVAENKDLAETVFFTDVRIKYPEFQAKFEKYVEESTKKVDIMEYIRDNSQFLYKEENKWMKSIMTIVRNTSVYFGPQMRTKILNEGWASYWHDELFRKDDRISGHEIGYAKLNAGVTSISRIGLNPYAIGLRLIQYVEELAEKGKIDYNFQMIRDIETRENYDMKAGKGKEAIFNLRSNFSDFMLVNTFTDQEFVDKHNLFVVGERFNQDRGTVEYYIKSRKANDYKKMLVDSLYHPVVIDIDKNRTNEDNLYLVHKFENKQIYKPYIADTLMGIEYLWGSQVQLETTEIIPVKNEKKDKKEFRYERVLYTMKDRKVTKTLL
ncbi:MAG: SpoVR family protein [Bacteroidota bacterium]|nr:SpoVR family protein [Bacteroidota bacterium]